MTDGGKGRDSLNGLLQPIQERLLETISLVLAKRPYRISTGPSADAAAAAAHGGEVKGSELVWLSLHTLGTFNLDNHAMLGFMCDCAVRYLEDDVAETRREAALACAHLLERRGGALAGTDQSSRAGSVRRMRAGVEEVLDKLLMVAVADPEPEVRQAMMTALFDAKNQCFDDHLSQADSLRALFISLNDESGAVCATAISLVGRLANRNPAYVLPALRRHLLQLLTELEHSADTQNKEQSARLLGCLIQSCPRLILPYVAPVLKALVAKLRSSTGSTATGPAQGGSATASTSLTHHAHQPQASEQRAAAERRFLQVSVLATIGALAQVSGATMRPYVRELLPLLLDALRDGGAAGKRQVAVSTLGQLVQSTGYVVLPYIDYPPLLSILLRLLNENSVTRFEVLKTLGIIGALDPHSHKMNQLNMKGEGNLPADGVRGQRQVQEGEIPPQRDGEDHELVVELLPSSGLATSSEEYYPTVAINALMQVLRDGSLSSHHLMVVRSLMFIFQALGLSCVSYLPKVMPVLFHVMRTCEGGLREFMFQQLTVLVSIIRQHIRKYLDELLALVYEFWGNAHLMQHLLRLLEELSRALHDEFRSFMPELLPRCVGALAEAERSGDYSSAHHVLHALEVFSSSVEEHLHLVLPAMVRLFQPGVAEVPLAVRRATLQSLGRLLPRMQLAGYASAIVHPFARCLDSASLSVDPPHHEHRGDEPRAQRLTSALMSQPRILDSIVSFQTKCGPSIRLQWFGI
ncbi:hypothetical protein CYMTET_25479 [Cymbomonas tetramitiformis]|uniref:Serine/threonine-protein kinase TOR n=1 Tax=Cymbomonas tetramitiformis TaxID=36881 RepID=A0AAE0FTQ2_9CHLO|nr:hypothetical protein CYMTET_25479 [Cymbomonas tetramitiformis]